MASPVDDLPSQPLAGDAFAHASQQPASNPESFLGDLGTAAHVAAGTTPWSYDPPPPYVPTAPTSGGAYNPSFSSPIFFSQPPPVSIMEPAMANPSYCWYPPTTQMGYPSCFAPAPFAQGAMAPPVLVPMQITRAEPSYPSYHSQTQGTAASAAEETVIARAVREAQEPQEATKPAPRRRGRPCKNATAGGGSSKPPNKRATARSNRAASQQTTSVATTMAGQDQVKKLPADQTQAAIDFAVATSDEQTAPCMNPNALVYPEPSMNPMASVHTEPWQLQPVWTNAAEPSMNSMALVHPEPWQLQPVWSNAVEDMMPPYADTSAAGVRFQPRDEELISYLRKKHAGERIPVDFFRELDVYHEHPETTKAACVVVDDFWYAFSPRDRKYKNGDRPARSVINAGGEQVGYWKSNTKLADVRAGGKEDGALIGKVTSLTFHLGRQPHGTQTPWKMKEYAIPENQHAPDGSAMRLNDWVVCKLFYKERVTAASRKQNRLGEAGENVNQAEEDEGSMQMVSAEAAEQTLGSSEQDLSSSEQDLSVEDYLVSEPSVQ